MGWGTILLIQYIRYPTSAQETQHILMYTKSIPEIKRTPTNMYRLRKDDIAMYYRSHETTRSGGVNAKTITTQQHNDPTNAVLLRFQTSLHHSTLYTPCNYTLS